MFTLKMNDAAALALGGTDGLPGPTPAGLSPGLRDRLERGLVRRGAVLTWAGSTGGADVLDIEPGSAR